MRNCGCTHSDHRSEKYSIARVLKSFPYPPKNLQSVQEFCAENDMQLKIAAIIRFDGFHIYPTGRFSWSCDEYAWSHSQTKEDADNKQ